MAGLSLVSCQGSQQREGSVELASLSRRIFINLHQLGEREGKEETEEGEISTVQDAVVIPV